MMYARTRRLPRHLLWAVFLLIGASLSLVLVQGRMPFGRSAGVNALLPVIDAGSSAADSIEQRVQSAFAADSIAAENEMLREEIARLRAENSELASKIIEYDQELLLSEQIPAYAARTLAARVIAPIQQGRERRLWIHGGSDIGFVPGQAVLGTRGIIGVIRETFDHYSVVQLTTGETSKWGGEAAGLGEFGVVRGTGDERFMRFQLEKTTTALQPGDEVVTSGMKGSLAPAGILLGIVTEVSVDEAGERHATLEIPEIPENLRYVYVLNASQIAWEPPK